MTDVFKNTIASILKTGLKEEDVKALLTKDNFKQYEIAFTSKKADEKVNYEVYEQLGDVSIGKFIVNYMYRRFPQLQSPNGVDVVAKLKIKYGSKEQLQRLSESLNFWPLIKAESNEYVTDKKRLLEDVFESFIGCTEYIIDDYISNNDALNNYGGIGYNIVYLILKSLFDKIDISLKYENLVDAKTRLNELITTLDGKVKYINVKDENIHVAKIVWEHEGKKETIGEEKAILKKDADEKAAKAALKYLEVNYNKIKEPPARFKEFMV